MIYTTENLHYCIGVTLENFCAWTEERITLGFFPISISLAGPPLEPLYTAVMVKFEPAVASQSLARLTHDELAGKIAELGAGDRPLHPYLISATGAGADIIYAVSFRAMATQPYVMLNMPQSTYNEENGTQRALGRILLWVDAFGSPDDIRYCAIWEDNPDRVAWNAEAIDYRKEGRQQRFEAMNSVDARPALIALTPTRGVARLFVDSRLRHGWYSLPERKRGAFQTALTRQQAAGRLPIRIATTLADGEVRLAAIFAKSDEILPRTFRITGPDPIGLDAANLARAARIDERMKSYVLANNLRGAALAVVDGTRLVYARGYTFAEPEPYYMDIKPTTLFRLASVSKTFAALAVWKALTAGTHSLSSRMQDILGLKRSDGSEPPAPFADITIQHLLESNSGLHQWSVRHFVSRTAGDPNAAQPVTDTAVEHAVADRTMAGTPGQTLKDGRSATAYGRTDYVVLGWIAARLAAVGSFDAALAKLVLEPLHMTRTRGARSRVEDRQPDEAIHHVPTLESIVSRVHDDRRIVPTAYGELNYEAMGGAAGICSAVVDLARIGAALNCPVDSPLFSRAVLDDLLRNAVSADTAGSGEGYHGFDTAKEAEGAIALEKGGGLPGVRAELWGRTGQRFIAIARNGNDVARPYHWSLRIDKLAEAVDWGTGDLFPQFGMPPLT